MKEKDFVKQKHKQWRELEELLARKESNPDQLAKLFIQTTEDLSFSRTHYKNRSVRVYLNALASKIFSLLLKQKKTSFFSSFMRFWREELPYIMWTARKDLLVSFLFFLIAVLIGVFSSIVNDDFASEILSDRYVNMTKENIANGDPMAVYKDMHQSEMFLGITSNNITVALKTYIYGLMAALGTLFIMLYNGIMVGTFQYFFIERGLFWESFLAIWLHGTIEISCIIIAGAAGLVLGKSFIFPETHSRFQSFLIGVNRSIKIMLGIIPLIILAGAIESFLTRYTDVPDVLRLILIICSFALVLFMFVINPLRKGKSLAEKYGKAVPFVPTTRQVLTLDTSEIKAFFQLIREAILSFSLHLGSYLKVAFFISCTYGTAVLWNMHLTGTKKQVGFSFFYYMADTIIDYDTSMITPIAGVNALFLLFFISFKRIKKTMNVPKKENSLITKSNIIWMLLASMLCNAPFLIEHNFFAVLLFMLMIIVCSLWGTAVILDGSTIKEGFKKATFVLKNTFFNSIGLNLLLTLFFLLACTIIGFLIVYFYIEVININIPFEGERKELILNFCFINLFITALALLMPIIIQVNVLTFYSLLEEKNATFLRQRIAEVFSKKKRVFGMTTE